MSLSVDDRWRIHETIALHGHLVDAGAHDRLDEVFTPNLELDLGGADLEPVPIADPDRALEVYIAAGKRRPGKAVAMHVTNTLVRENGGGATAWSKAMLVDAAGGISCFTYEDHLVRTGDGWRIRRRRIDARRDPGQGPAPDAGSDGSSGRRGR